MQLWVQMLLCTVSVTNMKDSEGGMFSDSEAFTFQSISQGDGDLEITLSNPNQVGDNVPQGAVAVNMVSYDLTASCSDSVSVSRMLMIHEGAGSRSDIDSVYVSIDGTRVSSTKSINSDEEANITISPALMIPACATVQVDIAADFNTGVTPGGEHRFALYSADDVRSNAKSVTMNGPLTGETFEVATVPAGIVQFKYNSVSPSTTDIGEEDVTVADFEVKASSDEDVTFMSITLEQDGTISSDDLTNLNLYRGSTKVAGPVEMMGDYVTFMVNEYIDSSDSEDYEVRADILDGAGDTIQFSLEETSDLKAVGAKYGNGTNGQVYGSPVDRTNHPAGSSQTVDVEAGEFTIELDGPISTTFSPDTDDANMANVTFEIGSEAVELNELWFFVSAVHGSGSGLTSNEIDDRLDNVELVSAYRTETLDFESFTTPAAGFAGYTLEDITFDRAVEEFTFNVDFTDNAVTGERYQVHVCTASQFATSAAGSDCAFTAFGIGFSPSTTEFHVDAEGAVSNEDIIDVDPGSVESGKIHDVEEASLEISVVSQRANDSAVDDANDINLFRFELSASETNSIFIDELKFKATSGSVGNGKNYALFIERDGVLTELEGGETPSNSDTEVIFDDFREEIAADEFVFFEVHADVDTSVASATLQLDFAGANPVANPTQFIDSEDNEGNDLDDADITVDTTNDGTLWTFVPAGTLETTVSTVTASKQLLAGNVDTTNILTIEFEAEFEDIRIEQLNFATTAPVDSVAYLELYVDGSTTPIIASNTSCAGVTNPGAGDIFCADNDIVVEDDTSVYVEVHPFLKAKENTTIGDTNIPGGAESGENVTVQLLSDLTMGPGNLAVEAYGVESDEQLTTTVVTTITSEPHTVVFAAVESIVNANSDGATSNSISVGNNPFGVFEWNTADNVNSSDVELDAIIFDVIANNVEFSAGSFVLYEEGKANNDVTCTESIVAPAPVTGSFEVTCTGLTASAVDTTLEANTSVAFVLEGVITDNASGPAGSTSTLQASITDFTDPALTSFGSANSHVQWNDSEATGAGSIFWIEFPTTFIKSTSYSQSN